MYTNILEILKNNDISYRMNEPMSEHTTFRIGGCADIFVIPDNTDKLITAIKAVKKSNIDYYVVGRGSNLIFPDDGYKGIVVSTEGLKNISVSGNTIVCDCGVSMNVLSSKARDAALKGLSFAYGIPGFVGGAVFMNAGAYGGQISDVLVRSTYYDTETGKIGTFEAADHKFGYRESVYKENPSFVILSAEFVLENGDPALIKAEMDDFMERRRTKQPLEFPSAGSVFKRPVGYFAGQLIEECGFKGKGVGGAVVSEKHAGFIVNIGGATAKDVADLVDWIKREVFNKYGVELVCEIIFVK